MTKRRIKYSVLVVTALLHLFADVAFAGGAILCVGPDDHLAIESTHAASVGCQLEQSSSGLEALATQLPGTECADSELHSDAEIAPSSEDGSDLAPTTVSLPNPYGVASRAVESRVRALNRQTRMSTDMRAHSSIVLLL